MQISHRAGLFELELIVAELREKVRVSCSVNFKRGLDSEGAVSTLPGGGTCFLKG